MLHALNLLTDEEHTLVNVKKFHLAQDLLAFTDESGALYSFDFVTRLQVKHDDSVRKFKASKKVLVWVNKQRSLKSYVAGNKEPSLIQKNCDFFQVAWPMLAYVDLGYQLYGANLESKKNRVLSSSFYQFQALKSGILALDRSYTLLFYNTDLKRVTLVNDIERLLIR